MPYKPFDYNEATSYTIRQLIVEQYEPTKFKPWRQTKPDPSSDIVFVEPQSKILAKFRLAIVPTNPQIDIIGAALIFPPQFCEELSEQKQQDQAYLSSGIKVREAEKQRKRNEGSSTSQEIRKNLDQ